MLRLHLARGHLIEDLGNAAHVAHELFSLKLRKHMLLKSALYRLQISSALVGKHHAPHVLKVGVLHVRAPVLSSMLYGKVHYAIRDHVVIQNLQVELLRLGTELIDGVGEIARRIVRALGVV